MSKVLNGKVVSNSLQKTIVVEVERKVRHKIYKKIIKKSKKYLVDTNNMEVKLGEFVNIVETRPISKRKRFKLKESLGEVKV